MQRMFNLDKWTRLDKGKGLEFTNPRPRNVRLEVNSPVKAALHVIDEHGEDHFLALVEGRETVEFGTTGAFSLTSDAECNVYTADGADISSVVVEPVILTKIAERRARNPELEYLQRVMYENMERRIAATEADFARRLVAERGTGSGSTASPVETPPAAPQDSTRDPEPARTVADDPAPNSDAGNGEQAGGTA